MLVCAIFAQFGTRDRGCSTNPAFPATSIFEGEDIRICITRAKTRRENNFRRPGEGRGPYAAADVVRKLWSTALLQQLRTVIMGPGLRRGDDGGRCAAW